MAFYRLPIDVTIIGSGCPLGDICDITSDAPYQNIVEWYECNLHNVSDEVGVDILKVFFDTSSDYLMIDFTLKQVAAKPNAVFKKLANPSKEYIKIDNFGYLVTGEAKIYLVEYHNNDKVAWPFTY